MCSKDRTKIASPTGDRSTNCRQCRRSHQGMAVNMTVNMVHRGAMSMNDMCARYTNHRSPSFPWVGCNYILIVVVWCTLHHGLSMGVPLSRWESTFSMGVSCLSMDPPTLAGAPVRNPMARESDPIVLAPTPTACRPGRTAGRDSPVTRKMGRVDTLSRACVAPRPNSA